MKKTTAWIAVLFLIFSLCACNGGKDEKAESGIKTETEKKSEKKAESGGELSVYSYKPDTLCPLLSENKANVNMLKLVYEGLFSVDGHLNAVPLLAESAEASDGNKRYTVRIKKGIRFHDGSELNADDVLYSVRVIKANPGGAYSKNLSKVASVKKLGDYEVEFRLIKPLALFLNLLDFPVIKSAAAMPGKENFSPIGTGAFKYENRNEGNRFHLVKNSGWHGKKVYPDSITVRLLPDKDTALYAFASGDISVCPAEGEEWGKFVDSENSEYIKYPSEGYYFLGLNHKKETLKEDAVRKALFYALNREEIFKDVFMDFGAAANAPIRPEWAFCPEKKEPSGDLGKARAELEKGGWQLKGGVYKKAEGRRNQSLKFSIIYCADSYKAEQLAKKIAERLTEFGVQTSVKKLDYEKYNLAASGQNYDMLIGKMLLSKELDYSVFFGEGNIFGIDDEELYNASAEIQKSEDAEELKANFQALRELMEKKIPFIGLGFEDGVMLKKKNLKGEFSPSTDNIYGGMEKIYISEK